MLFIDFENFNIAKYNYYKKKGLQNPKIDFNDFPKQLINKLKSKHVLVKTFLFYPKPDDFLMQHPQKAKIYNWIETLKNMNHFAVVEGSHIARPINGKDTSTMDINDSSTYNVVEKGTDVNVAVHILTKAFHNAFDTAVILSGDTDYLPIVNTLNMMGKSVVMVGVEGQNLSKFKECSDAQVYINDSFFNNCKL